MKRHLSIFFVATIASACASLGKKASDDKITLSDTSAAELDKVKSAEAAGKFAYSVDETDQQVEWFGCKAKESKRTVILHHAEGAAFTGPGFCDQWQTQVFLTSGFDVIAINRPGHGASTGSSDFAGPQSVAAIAKVIETAPTEGGFPNPVKGMWGFDAGATAAAVAAKRLQGLEFLILGNGFYDMEETASSTTSGAVKGAIQGVLEREEDIGIEYRSIAWDPANLPQRILIYHGKNDVVALPKQAETFRDSLASGQYKVTLQVIDGIAHDIPPAHHQQIVKILAESLPK